MGAYHETHRRRDRRAMEGPPSDPCKFAHVPSRDRD